MEVGEEIRLCYTEDGLEILHRRMIGVFYSDLRSNWNIMEALLPRSGQLLENSDLAKILLDAKRLSTAKGDKDKTPNGNRNRNNNRRLGPQSLETTCLGSS